MGRVDMAPDIIDELSIPAFTPMKSRTGLFCLALASAAIGQDRVYDASELRGAKNVPPGSMDMTVRLSNTEPEVKMLYPERGTGYPTLNSKSTDPGYVRIRFAISNGLFKSKEELNAYLKTMKVVYDQPKTVDGQAMTERVTIPGFRLATEDEEKVFLSRFTGFAKNKYPYRYNPKWEVIFVAPIDQPAKPVSAGAPSAPGASIP